MTPPPSSSTYSEPLAPSLVAEAPITTGARWGAYRAEALRVVRFGIAGGLASAVYLGLFAVLLAMGMHYLAASALGYLSAVATNFIVNRQWTFERGVRSIHIQALGFLGLQLCMAAMNLSLLHMLVVSGVRPIILAQVLAAATLFPLNFLASRRWGFR